MRSVLVIAAMRIRPSPHQALTDEDQRQSPKIAKKLCTNEPHHFGINYSITLLNAKAA